MVLIYGKIEAAGNISIIPTIATTGITVTTAETDITTTHNKILTTVEGKMSYTRKYP